MSYKVFTSTNKEKEKTPSDEAETLMSSTIIPIGDQEIALEFNKPIRETLSDSTAMLEIRLLQQR